MNPGGNITDIMVVDDDKLICLLQSSGLKKRLSLPVAVQYNGKSALDQILIAPNKIFLVLLDINMPVMNGWDFLEEVTRLNLNDRVRVVMVSSSVAIRDRANAMEFEVVIDYMEKPLLSEQFEKLAIYVETGAYPS